MFTAMIEHSLLDKENNTTFFNQKRARFSVQSCEHIIYVLLLLLGVFLSQILTKHFAHCGYIDSRSVNKRGENLSAVNTTMPLPVKSEFSIWARV